MLEVAKKAAREAGKLVRALHGSKLEVKVKGKHNDIVSEADLASEEKLFQIIGSAFPNHNFLSEEAGSKNNKSDFTWCIDPLDGTHSFVAGAPIFSVSIGLLKNNQPYLGVVNCPALNLLFWAKKGTGAFLNGKRISVSQERNLGLSWVGCDLGYNHLTKAVPKILPSII